MYEEGPIIIPCLAILLLLMVAIISQATPLNEFTSLDLRAMQPAEQMAFMEGFILGSYAAALLANTSYELSAESARAVMLLDVWPSDLLQATLAWYARTGAFKIPLFVAIYRRGIDQ